MRNKDYNIEKNGLRQLFGQLPDASLPTDFRARMMQRIEREAVRKVQRQTWREWIWGVVASLALVALAVFSWRFWDIPKLQLPQMDTAQLGLYSFVGAMMLFLLLLDYRFRRWYYKKHGHKQE